MRAAEVKFSEIKLIWSLKYILGRWVGGRCDGDRWDGGRCFWKTPSVSRAVGGVSDKVPPKFLVNNCVWAVE